MRTECPTLRSSSSTHPSIVASRVVVVPTCRLSSSSVCIKPTQTPVARTNADDATVATRNRSIHAQSSQRVAWSTTNERVVARPQSVCNSESGYCFASRDSSILTIFHRTSMAHHRGNLFHFRLKCERFSVSSVSFFPLPFFFSKRVEGVVLRVVIRE